MCLQVSEYFCFYLPPSAVPGGYCPAFGLFSGGQIVLDAHPVYPPSQQQRKYSSGAELHAAPYTRGMGWDEWKEERLPT